MFTGFNKGAKIARAHNQTGPIRLSTTRRDDCAQCNYSATGHSYLVVTRWFNCTQGYKTRPPPSCLSRDDCTQNSTTGNTGSSPTGICGSTHADQPNWVHRARPANNGSSNLINKEVRGPKQYTGMSSTVYRQPLIRDQLKT